MTFRPAKQQPQFADLKGILAQTKKSDDPLYQTIQQIIERLTQFQLVTLEQIADINNSINDVLSQVTNVNNVTNIVNPQMPFLPGDSGGDEVIGEMGPPGPRGATGPAGPSGSAFSQPSLPYWSIEEPEVYPEILPLLDLWNPRVILETAIIDGSLLARVADNETISGNWTFTAARVNHQNNAPQYVYAELDAAADNKLWRTFVNGNLFTIDIVNDANTVTQNVLVATRSGMNVTDISLYSFGTQLTSWDGTAQLHHRYGLRFSGGGGGAVTADQTAWNPTGLGTTFIINATPSANWIIRGITAQLGGYLCIIRNMNTSAGNLQFNHLDGAASAGNQIMCPNNANFTMHPGDSLLFYYDSFDLRWYPIGL